MLIPKLISKPHQPVCLLQGKTWPALHIKLVKAVSSVAQWHVTLKMRNVDEGTPPPHCFRSLKLARRLHVPARKPSEDVRRGARLCL